MASSELVERALAALDEAFGDLVKREFEALVASISGGEKPDAALPHFATGMHNLKAAREAAASVIRETFKDPA